MSGTCIFSAPITGRSSIFSPCAKYLACIEGGSRLIVRESNSLNLIHMFQCVDKIEKFEFSPDSCYIQCGLYARNAIQVFSMSDNDFKCRINEGVAGMINSWWSADSRTIIIESDFGIQLSFWSLVDSTSAIISLPKPSLSQSKGILSQVMAYSDISNYVAVVHRIELQDHIAVYSHENSTLTELTKFKARSNDISYIRWMTGDTHIITVDSPLTYKLCVYTPSGELMANFEAYQHALGIRSLALPPLASSISSLTIEDAKNNTDSYSLIAIGSFDGSVRVLSTYSWQLAFTLPCIHPRDMSHLGVVNCDLLPTIEVAVGESVNDMSFAASLTSKQTTKGGLKNTLNSTSNSVFRGASVSSYSEPVHKEIAYAQRAVKVLPRVIVDARPSAKTAASTYPSMGVAWTAFSAGGVYLAARDESHPRCLWIWNPAKCRLEALLIQLDNITCAQWRPELNTTIQCSDDPSDVKEIPPVLAFCTGNSRVYFWNPLTGATWADAAGATSSESEVVETDDGSAVSTVTTAVGLASILSLEWDAEGKHILLRGKEAHSTCEVTLSDFCKTPVKPHEEDETHEVKASSTAHDDLMNKYKEMRSTVTLEDDDDEDYL